jgi:hypothetical protein
MNLTEQQYADGCRELHRNYAGANSDRVRLSELKRILTDAAPTPEPQDALPDAGLLAVRNALQPVTDRERKDFQHRPRWQDGDGLADFVLKSRLDRLSRADSERVTPNIQCFEYGDGDGLWCVVVNHDRDHPDSEYGLNERRAKLLAGALKAEMAQSSTRGTGTEVKADGN